MAIVYFTYNASASNGGRNFSSAANGVAYDTITGKTFYFKTTGAGENKFGQYIGATVAGYGVFNGSKEQFMGKGFATNVSVGFLEAGAGVTVFRSGGQLGIEFSVKGQGLGATVNVQDTNTCEINGKK